MGKQIIDLIGEIVSISGNSTVDTIIFAIIGSISGAIAFGIIGLIFDAIGIYDSDLMSDTHWAIRILVFVGLTYLGIKIAQAIKWLFSFQWWIYVIASIIIIGIIVLAYYLKHRISKRKAKKIVPVEEHQIDTAEQIEDLQPKVTERKNYCPRCHSKLVKRHGPYGNFYGCEAYGKTGCNYTRKFL